VKPRPPLLSLIALVACAIAASYLTNLIIAVSSARLTMSDKCLLRQWVDLVEYPEMQDLPSRADAVRSWARTAAEKYSKQPRRWRGMSQSIDAASCPAGLTPLQAQLIRHVVWRGLNSGAWETRERRKHTWKDVLFGSCPLWDKKPSDCLNPHLLDQYPHEPLEHETWYTFSFSRPEEVVANREALGRLANNNALLEVIDQCWRIGYQSGCLLSDDW
jgi:hypothetical protein